MTAAGAAALGAGVLLGHFLIPQLVGAVSNWKTMRAPAWGWTAVAAASMVLTHVMGAAVLTGSTMQTLRPATTFSVQFAVSFSNRLAPSGLGGMATTAWYLRRRGAEPAAAAASIAIASTAGFIQHVVFTAATLAVVAPRLLGHWHPARHWAVGVAVAGAAALLGFAFRHQIASRLPLRSFAREFGDVISSRRRSLLLFGGSAGVTTSYAAALGASMYAFGVRIGPVDVLAAYLAASALAAGSPTPGGMGAAEAALIAVTTGLVGQSGRVVEAVLAYRFITYWLPAVPGALALIQLRRRAVL